MNAKRRKILQRHLDGLKFLRRVEAECFNSLSDSAQVSDRGQKMEWNIDSFTQAINHLEEVLRV